MAAIRDDKLVTIKLVGDLLQTGFQVTVEVGQDDQRPLVEQVGTLPPDAELLKAWQTWRTSYHSLKSPTRIRPLEISYHGSIHQKVGECVQQSQTFHQHFQQWLADPRFQPLNQLLREELNKTDRIRVVIRTDNLSLQQMPWHLWDLIDRYPFAEVGLTPLSSQRLSAVAQTVTDLTTDGLPQLESADPAGQVRVLAILGDSTGIDVEQDKQLIEALPHARVTYLVEPARDQLNTELWNQPWDILFFAGHSASQRIDSSIEDQSVDPSDRSPGQSMLDPSRVDSDRQPQRLQGRLYINPHDSLTIEDLSYGFRRAIANGLQLAIFNSCDGLGLGQALKTLGLPHMILMREPVPDSVAQTFLRHFLTAFSAGDSLYLAEKQARERLQGLENTFPCASWLPVVMHASPTSPPSWQQLQQRSASPKPVPQRPDAGKASGAETMQSPQSVCETRDRRRRWALTSGAIAAVVVSAIRGLGGLQPLELRTFDHLMQHQRSASTTERILMVEVTESDLNTYGYPLPDEILADAIASLTPHNPRVIGLDIFRPQPTAPDLKQAFSDTPQLVTACSPGSPDNPNRPGFAGPPGVPEERLGFTTVVNDPDGVIRRQLMFAHDPNVACDTRFALSTLMALHYLDQEGISPENLDRQRVRLGKTTFTPLEKHTGPYHDIDSWGSQVFLGYGPEEALAQRITLSALLNPASPLGDSGLDDLSKTAVLIGVTAPISNPTDYFLTPQGASQWPQQKISGVALHAHMLNHLLVAALEGKGTIRALPGWGEYSWIVLWALWGAGAVLWQTRRKLLWWLMGGSVVGLYGLCLGLFWAGLVVPLIPALLAFSVASALTHVGHQRHDRIALAVVADERTQA